MSFAWFGVVQASCGAELFCSGGSVWGCSEKVPIATGRGLENDRGRVAIGGKGRQKHVGFLTVWQSRELLRVGVLGCGVWRGDLWGEKARA
jgi:hypothetical protein